MVTGRETWLPDELSTAGRENLDPVHVGRYDDKEDAHGADEVAMLLALGLADRLDVIELGSGTGQFTLAMAKHAATVRAVDVSPVMLDRLRAKIDASGATNVETVRAGFLSYEHEGEPVDVVYSRYALHHLPDFWKAVALTRIAGWLRPGGVFRLWDVVYSFDAPDTAAALERWMGSVAGQTITDGWVRSELEVHVRDEHSTFTWLLEPMIVRAGLVIERAEYSDDQVVARYLCRRVSD